MRYLLRMAMAGGFLLMAAATGQAHSQDDRNAGGPGPAPDFPRVGALYDMSFIKESTPSHNLRVAAISTKNPNWIYVEELQFGKPGSAEATVEKVVSRQWLNLTFVVAANEIPYPTEPGH